MRPIEGAAAAIAFDIELEDRRVMDGEPDQRAVQWTDRPANVDGREGHGWVRDDPVPFAEGLVRGDQDGSALVSRALMSSKRTLVSAWSLVT